MTQPRKTELVIIKIATERAALCWWGILCAFELLLRSRGARQFSTTLTHPDVHLDRFRPAGARCE